MFRCRGTGPTGVMWAGGVQSEADFWKMTKRVLQTQMCVLAGGISVMASTERPRCKYHVSSSYRNILAVDLLDMQQRQVMRQFERTFSQAKQYAQSREVVAEWPLGCRRG